MSAGYLFHDPGRLSLGQFLAEHGQRATNAIEALSHDEVLGRPEEDLIAELLDRFSVPEPRVHRDRLESPHGAQDGYVNAGRDFYGQGVSVPAIQLDVHVPVDGPPEAFTRNSSSYSTSLPPGRYQNGELILTVMIPHQELGAADIDSQVRAALDRLLDQIEAYTSWAATEVARHNETLVDSVRTRVAARRRAVLLARNLEASLGIPVRRSSPAPVLAVDVNRRHPITATRRSSTAAAVPFAPEPALTVDQTAAVVDVVIKWREAVERLPGTFAPMPEEALRDNLLAALNGSFTYAGGELVRRSGKTDLTVLAAGPGGSVAAVFVAELKFWRGPKQLHAAIDQLLGYTLWRDATVTLILLVRQRDPSTVCAKAEEHVTAHALYKRPAPAVHDCPTFTFEHPRDAAKELRLVLVCVPIPLDTADDVDAPT